MLGSEGLSWQSLLQEDVCQNEEFMIFGVLNTDADILYFPAVRQMIRMLYFQREKREEQIGWKLFRNGQKLFDLLFDQFVFLYEVLSAVAGYCVFRVFCYRSGTVNSKSFVGKVLLRIKWKFELN